MSDWQARLGFKLTRLAIVLVFFPTFAWISSVMLGLVWIPAVWLLPDSWQDEGRWVATVVSQLAGLGFGVAASWKIWPRERNPDSETVARERA